LENIFIQKIFALTEEILRGDFQFEPMKAELDTHLAKAQKMQLPRYEAEVFNTLGALYLLNGDRPQGTDYFLSGLKKALQTDDTDLKMKLLNNLSETYLEACDFEQARVYLDEGLALGRQYQLTTLVMLYLYSNKVNYWVLKGDFAQAGALLDEAWQIAETPDLLKYSKYEYLQVVFLLRNLKAVIEIASGHCEAALAPLQLAVGLAQDTKNVDYHVLTHISRLYYDLLCKRDETSARHWEKTAVETRGGPLPYNTALNIALFMLHNRQYSWAEQYARLVLEQARQDKRVPTAAVSYAEGILTAIESQRLNR
jgi:tetratricopeptide (TPR) repeat protein